MWPKADAVPFFHPLGDFLQYSVMWFSFMWSDVCQSADRSGVEEEASGSSTLDASINVFTYSLSGEYDSIGWAFPMHWVKTNCAESALSGTLLGRVPRSYRPPLSCSALWVQPTCVWQGLHLVLRWTLRVLGASKPVLHLEPCGWLWGYLRYV